MRGGENVHGCGVGADGGGIDPGDGSLDGEVVDEVAGLEVVGGVEDEVAAAEQFGDVCRDKVGDAGMDGDGGVEEGDLAAGGFGLGQRGCGVGLVEEDLTLKVGGFDEVAVDEGEGANAGTGEERGGRGTSGSAANDGDMSSAEALLTELADAGKEDLAGVAVPAVGRRLRWGTSGPQICSIEFAWPRG